MAFFTMLGIGIGMTIGYVLTENRWRDNAKRVYRIESWGRIFKVRHADDD